MKKTRRRARGSILAETVAGIAFVLPLIVLVIFFALQAGYAFAICRCMNQGANIAARALAEQYASNSNLPNDSNAQQAVFSNIRLVRMIHDNSQFEIVNWNTSGTVKTVTVRVSYIPGAGSPPLPPFPNPDLFGLGSAWRIKSAATYRLD